MSFSSFSSQPASGSSRSSSRYSREDSETNTYCDIIVYLDDDSLDKVLPNWEAMESKVDIWLLCRGIHFLGAQKHCAWLFIGETFYCTIEFGNEGIVIQYFRKEKGLVTVCDSIMGDDNRVYYIDNYSTKMNFAEILRYTVTLKAQWGANNYSTFTHNCRHFAFTMGTGMNCNFNSSKLSKKLLLNGTSIYSGSINIP